MQGKVSQNNEQKDLKIIQRVPNDKHVAFIVHNDSQLCDTCIDLFTEFPEIAKMLFILIRNKREPLFFIRTSSKPVEKC